MKAIAEKLMPIGIDSPLDSNLESFVVSAVDNDARDYNLSDKQVEYHPYTILVSIPRLAQKQNILQPAPYVQAARTFVGVVAHGTALYRLALDTYYRAIGHGTVGRGMESPKFPLHSSIRVRYSNPYDVNAMEECGIAEVLDYEAMIVDDNPNTRQPFYIVRIISGHFPSAESDDTLAVPEHQITAI